MTREGDGNDNREYGVDGEKVIEQLLGGDDEGMRLLREEDGGELLDKSKRLVARMLRLKQLEKERIAKAKSGAGAGGRNEVAGVDGRGAMEEGDREQGSEVNALAYEAERNQVEYEMDLCVSHFKSRLLDLLAWRKPRPAAGDGSSGAAANGGDNEEVHADDESERFRDWAPGEGKGEGKSKQKPEPPLHASNEEKMYEGASAEERGGGAKARGEPPAHSRGGFACVLLDKAYNVAYRLEPMRNQVDAAAWLAFHVVLEMFGVRAARSVAADRPDVVMMADRAMASNHSHVSWNDTAVVRCYQV